MSEESKSYSEIIQEYEDAVATRFVLIGITLSWYIYLVYTIKSLYGLIKHRDLKFLFPLTATAFACFNNTNDLLTYVFRPNDCYLFYALFKASATLNWAPISWLQAYRLIIISKIHLRKVYYMFISIITICLSTIYCTFYFCNLSIFSYEKSFVMGCGVTNSGKYTYYVMISDITDSVFAFGCICILIGTTIKHMNELKVKNEKLNKLISEGLFELFAITIAKIVIYPLIAITSYLPAFDVFWDVLSVVVIICAYKLVNFPYNVNNETSQIKRNVFEFIGSAFTTVDIIDDKTATSMNPSTTDIKASSSMNNKFNVDI